MNDHESSFQKIMNAAFPEGEPGAATGQDTRIRDDIAGVTEELRLAYKELRNSEFQLLYAFLLSAAVVGFLFGMFVMWFVLQLTGG